MAFRRGHEFSGLWDAIYQEKPTNITQLTTIVDRYVGMEEVRRSHFRDQKQNRSHDEEQPKRPPRPDRRRDDRNKNHDD